VSGSGCFGDQDIWFAVRRVYFRWVRPAVAAHEGREYREHRAIELASPALADARGVAGV
jgi:hypothetical protein